MRNAIRYVMASLVVSLACDGNLGSVGDGGSESSDSGESSGGDGDPVACIGGQLCPEGTTCSNGVCATDCSSDADCDDDEYCGLDDLCHPNVVPSCISDQECAPTQTCINQMCTTLGDEGCDLENYLQDGCPSNAVCVENPDQPEQGACYQMPACAEDQTCPIGLVGAVCNTGQLPTKDAICLAGLCDVAANCPAMWMCIRYNNSVLGMCSDGSFGSACSDDGHCISGSCVLIPGLGGGFCG